MKYLIICLPFVCQFLVGYSQSIAVDNVSSEKFTTIPYSILDSSAIENWYGFYSDEDVRISSNGKFFSYSISNKPKKRKTLVVGTVVGGWKKEVIGGSAICFYENNKKYVYVIKDSLYFLDLTNKNVEVIGIKKWIQPKNSIGKWLAWQTSDEKDELVVRNLIDEHEFKLGHSNFCSFDEEGTVLWYTVISKEGAQVVTSVMRIKLDNGNATRVWQNTNSEQKLLGCVLDGSGKRIAINISEKGDGNSIWYYTEGMPNALPIANQKSPGISGGLQLATAFDFSPDGHYVFINLEKPKIGRMPDSLSKLNIWSYRDTVLQSKQLQRPFDNDLESPILKSVISVNGDSVIQLKQGFGDLVDAFPTSISRFVVIKKDANGDRLWQARENPASFWLVSLQDGKRSLLPIKGANSKTWFSPDGIYLLYYDSEKQGNYFSYELATGKTINLTGMLPSFLFSKEEDNYYPAGYVFPFPSPVGLAGWLKDKSAVLVYDNFDIWQLDLQGQKKPINLTNGYGRQRRIKLRLTISAQETLICLNDEKPLLLTAFNMQSKENGFYRKKIGVKGDPELLTMGPYTYFHSDLAVYQFPLHKDPGMVPLKAAKADVWIIKRGSATNAPNYFLTRDFKSFKQLTNIQPQIRYNWLTAELISWSQPDTIIGQGILYKPRNFDSTKKYPVIISFYALPFSQWLNQFPVPHYTNDGFIDIPWFVSRGYLVLIADVIFRQGKMTECGYNTLVSGAEYLSKFPFVDANRIGISTHSRGGQIAYYTVTHSSLFAAAFVGAGASDMVSSALELSGGIKKTNSRFSTSETYYGGNIWQRRERYLSESAVLNADKITTPLLIFHCMNDMTMPWEQGMEMYLACWRLNKKCWLLEYDGAGANHSVAGKDAKDLTIRTTQFFDHYLKGLPAPKWITSGVRASRKGFETGYESVESSINP
ncbi:alpha/beta hydrolase family protein [Niastella caeni]|nr:prolyl oligopeptidase family serine peptidase [Niastella caeni]